MRIRPAIGIGRGVACVLAALLLGVLAGLLVIKAWSGAATAPGATVEAGDYSRFQQGNVTGVVFYSLSTCSDCDAIRRLFQDRGVAYTEIELDMPDQALAQLVREQVHALGAQRVPLLLIGGYKIEGYDEERTLDILRKEGFL